MIGFMFLFIFFVLLRRKLNVYSVFVDRIRFEVKDSKWVEWYVYVVFFTRRSRCRKERVLRRGGGRRI